MEKKRYWLKLDKDFLKSPQIKVIKNMPNGKDYIIFYLSLLLESIETIGHLRFSNLVPYNEEMLSSVTDTSVDIVRPAMKLFLELGLVEILDDGTIYMTQVAQMTGKESESAERVRQYRLRKKEEEQKQLMLHCNDNVTKSNDNKEKEEEEDKDKQSTENNEDKHNKEKKEESVSASVSDASFNLSDTPIGELLNRHEITDIQIQKQIIGYLNNGMELEVVNNALMIPYDRNVMNFDFENEEAPINSPLDYGLQVLENWFNFGVRTMYDVKKYNKLNKNRNEMLGGGNNDN